MASGKMMVIMAFIKTPAASFPSIIDGCDGQNDKAVLLGGDQNCTPQPGWCLGSLEVYTHICALEQPLTDHSKYGEQLTAAVGVGVATKRAARHGCAGVGHQAVGCHGMHVEADGVAHAADHNELLVSPPQYLQPHYTPKLHEIASNAHHTRGRHATAFSESRDDGSRREDGASRHL